MKILLIEAIWCKDCKLMHTLWRNLKMEFPTIEIKHLDYTENEAYCKTVGVMEIPTAIFYDRDEKELERIVGVAHRDTVLDLINKYKNL